MNPDFTAQTTHFDAKVPYTLLLLVRSGRHPGMPLEITVEIRLRIKAALISNQLHFLIRLSQQSGCLINPNLNDIVGNPLTCHLLKDMAERGWN